MTDGLDEFSELKRSAEKFSLAPSPGVWKNVEREIRRKQRRRRFIIFLFTGIAALAVGVTLLMEQKKSNPVVEMNGKNNLPVVISPARPADKIVTQDDSTNRISGKTETVPMDPPAQSVATNAAPLQKKGNTHPRPSVILSKSGNENSGAHSSATNFSASSKNKVESRAPGMQHTDTVLNPEIVQTDLSFAETGQRINADSLVNSDVQKDSDSLHPVVIEQLRKDSLASGKDTAKVLFSKWSLSIGAAPAQSFTNFWEEGDYQFISHYRDSTDKALPAVNFHLHVNYQFTPRLEGFAGINVISYREQLNGMQIVYHYDTIPASGPMPQSVIVRKIYFNLDAQHPKNTLTYFGLPVGLRYSVWSLPKWSISLQPEISFNKMIRAKGFSNTDNRMEYRSITTADLRAWNLSYGIGVAFRYSFSDHFAFQLTPAYRYFSRSVLSTTNPVSQKFGQAELGMTLRYTFSK